MAFHWHGDTFEIPVGASCIAESEACPNQAFSFDDGRVLGLQFHLEILKDGIKRLVDNCRGELIENKYIQPPEEITARLEYVEVCNSIMLELLKKMELDK